MQHTCNRYQIFFTCEDIHFTLFPFMLVQDIEVIVLILSLVFLSNIKILLQMTCLGENHIKYYMFNLLKLFIFTSEMNPRTTLGNRSNIIIPYYTEGNHCNAVNEEFLRFGNATCFYLQSDSSFVTN